MKANPGGQLDPKSIVGRDVLVAQLWETVTQQSARLTAERRIGKTHVLKKMVTEPLQGWCVVYQDLEKCHSAMEFAQAVASQVVEHLGRLKKLGKRIREFYKIFEGRELNGVKLPEIPPKHWKELLTKSIEDLAEQSEETNTKLLFLWDEFPFMLINIRDRQSPETAMELLDVLRELRQSNAAFRMVLTGSIGLHHVLTSLKEKNYGNAPVNDVLLVEVPPLEMKDAVKLASMLLEGEGLAAPEAGKAAARAIASQSDCFPYYIHHIVKAMKLGGLDATVQNVDQVVLSQLVDAQDPWELKHYSERLRTYYGQNELLAVAVLDELACLDVPITLIGLLTKVKQAGFDTGRDELLRLLSHMGQDHYLKRDAAGSFEYRFTLIKRWWKLARGL